MLAPSPPLAGLMQATSPAQMAALSAHSQLVGNVDRIRIRKDGKALERGVSTRADLGHTLFHNNIWYCYKSPASNPGPGWGALS